MSDIIEGFLPHPRGSAGMDRAMVKVTGADKFGEAAGSLDSNIAGSALWEAVDNSKDDNAVRYVFSSRSELDEFLTGAAAAQRAFQV